MVFGKKLKSSKKDDLLEISSCDYPSFLLVSVKAINLYMNPQLCENNLWS